MRCVAGADLRKLSLRQNLLTSEAVAGLGQHSALHSLTELVLHDNKITQVRAPPALLLRLACCSISGFGRPVPGKAAPGVTSCLEPAVLLSCPPGGLF